MKRFHVHVSVEDLAANIQFYSQLFGANPTVQKQDYAKWMLDDPRVNFAISRRGAPLGLNHLGFQVDSNEELEQLNHQLKTIDVTITAEQGTACCYAMSDKYWINDPQGIAWEQFHTLESIPVFGEADKTTATPCCVPVLGQSKSAEACCTPSQGSSCC
ncbi:MAG: ArsI/CadI family heavy metal resistance metalloenzyme [Thiofilum sp.]|uniref:ArsI/CadI family heavy metal resistance metalloenzyme n=1 Tax=Thiofilum sp. TaxID=2212733 RepID=UPI0025EAE07A|nr:ArsI/CadI family heavy metal resistance metalloenzyme [Thiofilum sp.]MBK8451732.1 VOC family protein [Thiofilum sp.]